MKSAEAANREPRRERIDKPAYVSGRLRREVEPQMMLSGILGAQRGQVVVGFDQRLEQRD